MNYESLDRFLRQLEPYELALKNKQIAPDYSSWKKVTRNGEVIYIMEAFSSQSFHPLPKLDLYLNKNARFAPVMSHMHSWVELSYIYSGICTQKVKNTTYHMKKGQVIILDSETPHSINLSGEDDIIINILMKQSFFSHLFFYHFSNENVITRFLVNAISDKTSHDNFIIFQSEHNKRIPLFMNEIMCEFLRPSSTSHEIIYSLMTLIFSELVNVFEKEKTKESLNCTKSFVIPILHYVESNFKTCSLTSTASFFNISPNYLTTILKQQTGHSFKELIHIHRFQYATMMLRNTNISVEEIAAIIGYENSTYFYKKFRQQFNCSPKDYRMKYKAEPTYEQK